MNKIFRSAICLIALGVVLCGEGVCSTVTINTLDNCQGLYFDRIGSYSAASGSTFLVVGLEIVYSGEDAFSVDPSFFSASVNNFDYKYSSATYSLGEINLNPLPSGSIRDGGSARGYIAYEVPASRNSFQIVYSGWDNAEKRYACV
jgi:hypothetical protein